MSSRRRDNDTSMETILNYDNRDAQSQWSTIWSTTYIPGMDNATGLNRRRVTSRRRLQIGSLAIGALLSMHSRISASAVTDGYFVFMLTLTVAVAILANPLRHFEVYLGQWSISGPGRAFRIVPLLDGIGIAMCINAIFRAINYCTIAAIAVKYVLISIHDDKLPFTYCRDFDLEPYSPMVKELRYLTLHGTRLLIETKIEDVSSTYGWQHRTWRNSTKPKFRWFNAKQVGVSAAIEVCNETYPGPYPALYATPAFNYFYVEVVKLRPDFSLQEFNYSLMVIVVGVWIIIWITMISERLLNGRLIWNNLAPWISLIPWVWSVFVIITAISNMDAERAIRRFFRFGTKDIMFGLADGIGIGLYLHASSVGTELITGKGLNRFAAGHIDPAFNKENVWHSILVVSLAALNSCGAVLCASIDTKHPHWTGIDEMIESTLWIFPVYSKCTSLGNYSHFTSASVFLGLSVSYIIVAYVFLKTALHIIFEYRVQLVFKEQLVVIALIFVCALLSFMYMTYDGLALLESVDALLTGVAMPLICFLELVALLYVYRSQDFTSDANIAMEDTACSSRISIQWHVIPFLTLATLAANISMIIDSELPSTPMFIATIPIICVAISIPLRAIHNMYTYLYPGADGR